jgi:predicted tellurium resistance membrane protein TerC
VVVVVRAGCSFDPHRLVDASWTSALAVQVKVATPLLLVVAVIELSDVVFAVDSIPAIFGVTTDPFIVYTSNMFAILSLRALYGFVATVVDELEYLQTAVALVLGFIGLKLVGEVQAACLLRLLLRLTCLPLPPACRSR